MPLDEVGATPSGVLLVGVTLPVDPPAGIGVRPPLLVDEALPVDVVSSTLPSGTYGEEEDDGVVVVDAGCVVVVVVGVVDEDVVDVVDAGCVVVVVVVLLGVDDDVGAGAVP